MATLIAYLDPGTGSFILQVMIGGAFGSLLALKHYWHQLKRTLTPGSRRQDASSR